MTTRVVIVTKRTWQGLDRCYVCARALLKFRGLVQDRVMDPHADTEAPAIRA